MTIVPGFQEFFDGPVALFFKAIAHGVQVSAGVTVEKIVIEAENSLGSLRRPSQSLDRKLPSSAPILSIHSGRQMPEDGGHQMTVGVVWQ
jgi:hypothetical protein